MTATVFCQRVLRTADLAGGLGDGCSDPMDVLDIEWHERGRRTLESRTRAGRCVRVLLSADQAIEHGAILAGNGGARIVVNLVACEVLVIRPVSGVEAARIAYALGNAHVPAQIEPLEILVPASDATESVVRRLGIEFTIRTDLFRPALEELWRVQVAAGASGKSKGVTPA